MGSASRRDVLMNPDDAADLGAVDGQEIRLTSETGEWIGLAKLAPMKSRHLQAYWPETNVLISRRFDPVSGEPDYNEMVSVEPLGAAGGTTAVRVGLEARRPQSQEPAPAMTRTRSNPV